MNVNDAAHATVRAYPGGSESLAPRVGMSPAILRNKVNPNSATHRLAIEEANALMAVTGDFRMLHALAAEHGFVLQATAPADSVRTVLDHILGTQAREGELSKTLQDALADGVISENELSTITNAAFGVQEAVIALVNRLRAGAAQRPVTA